MCRGTTIYLKTSHYHAWASGSVKASCSKFVWLLANHPKFAHKIQSTAAQLCRNHSFVLNPLPTCTFVELPLVVKACFLWGKSLPISIAFSESDGSCHSSCSQMSEYLSLTNSQSTFSPAFFTLYPCVTFSSSSTSSVQTNACLFPFVAPSFSFTVSPIST